MQSKTAKRGEGVGGRVAVSGNKNKTIQNHTKLQFLSAPELLRGWIEVRAAPHMPIRTPTTLKDPRQPSYEIARGSGGRRLI